MVFPRPTEAWQAALRRGDDAGLREQQRGRNDATTEEWGEQPHCRRSQETRQTGQWKACGATEAVRETSQPGERRPWKRERQPTHHYQTQQRRR